MTQAHERYRDKLHALRAHLDAHENRLTEESPDTTDYADRASKNTEVAINIGLATHEADLRKEIDDALARIDAGTFGVCANCQAAISGKRLGAIPHARYCVRCERKIEQDATA